MTAMICASDTTAKEAIGAVRAGPIVPFKLHRTSPWPKVLTAALRQPAHTLRTYIPTHRARADSQLHWGASNDLHTPSVSMQGVKIE